MTVKLTIAYGVPEDPDAWDKHYFEEHVPIVERYPNLQRAEISKVAGGPFGTPCAYHVITDLYFEDEAKMNEALASEPGREAGNDFVQMAPPGTFVAVSTIV